MEQRGQFTFYRSYYEALKDLPKKDRSAVYEAICAYALDGIEPGLSGIQKSVFTLVRPTLDSGRKKAIGGKNGKPNSKDNGKIEESHPEDTEKEKEGEKEKEKEKEKEYECTHPLSPTQEETGFSDELHSTFCEWLEYKKQKRQTYKPMGLKSLISEIRNKAADYGDHTVAELIRSCMANNWQGIIWDRLSKPAPRYPQKKALPMGASGELGDAELAAIRKMMGN